MIIMDYMIDIYFEGDYEPSRVVSTNFTNNTNELYTQLIYNNSRYLSKIYILLKMFGLVFYTTMLSGCPSPILYFIMNGLMFLSIANNVRYEYKHFQKYGTTFTSVAEFDTWIITMSSKFSIWISITEVGMKIWYFIDIFPPQYEFNTLCDIGKNVLMIHIFAIFVIYYIIIIILLIALWFIYYYDDDVQSNSQEYNDSSLREISITLLPPISLNTISNEECCICMDNENTQQMTVLPCRHAFHIACIRRWLILKNTCPVCRVVVKN